MIISAANVHRAPAFNERGLGSLGVNRHILPVVTKGVFLGACGCRSSLLVELRSRERLEDRLAWDLPESATADTGRVWMTLTAFRLA